MPSRDFAADVDALRDRIRAGERGGTAADREALLAFSDELRLLSTEYSAARHRKLLRHCCRMAEQAPAPRDLPAEIGTEIEGVLAATPQHRPAAEVLLRWINDTYTNEETNRDYRSALRVYAKRVTPGDEVPEAVAWVPTGTSRSYDPAPDPSEMLRWDADVQPMLEATRNPRDAALIALQFEAGLRSGELYDLTVGDIADTEHGIRVFADGKTGQRSILLIAAAPYVTDWLAKHPAPTDDDAWLWSKLTAAERISNRRYLDVFHDAAERAGVEKPVTPTNFRRSNTAWLARRGANNAMIEDRQGREKGSEHVARYLARFGSEWDAQYAKLHGIEPDTDDETELPEPVECPRCEALTRPDKPTCQQCGQALDAVAAETLDEVLEDLHTLAITSDDETERRRALETEQRVRRDPDVLERVIEAYHEDGTSPNSSS